jgi:hypothetical protein
VGVDAAVEVEVELPVLVVGERRGGVVEAISSVRAPRLVQAGVDVLVSGSYVFKAKDPEGTIRSLRAL